MSITARFPEAADTIVIGAGTAGAAVAGRLAEGSPERTLLLEAGPDYGAADSGRWPRDLLDATRVVWSHDWGYTGEFAGQEIRFSHARVIGGYSSHNAGAIVFGSRSDYDGWAAAGNPGWSARELQPLFAFRAPTATCPPRLFERGNGLTESARTVLCWLVGDPIAAAEACLSRVRD